VQSPASTFTSQDLAMTTLHRTAESPFVCAQNRQAAGWLALSVDTIRCWAHRIRVRDALAELDEHMLKDIGLTRADIEVERSKYFWQR
jgi:uncharacterized protein YjiS (DUF1127 family)